MALGAALAYMVSPIQVIPNVIPVLGQADDVFVLTYALRYICRRLPREEVRAAWPGDVCYLERLLGKATDQPLVIPTVTDTCSTSG
jgi:uncharacterized membrane protein YkvA (DUF1232 family)